MVLVMYSRWWTCMCLLSIASKTTLDAAHTCDRHHLSGGRGEEGAWVEEVVTAVGGGEEAFGCTRALAREECIIHLL